MKRRAIASLNVLPYVDVMLVLLVIFMVVPHDNAKHQIDLPQSGSGQLKRTEALELILLSPTDLALRHAPSGTAVEHTQWEPALKLIRRYPDSPVVLSASGQMNYQQVLHALDRLKKEGIGRVSLLVKPN